jgi:hypothetical protein
VRNKKLSRIAKEERNSLHTKKTANWIGHILGGNCLIKHFIGIKVDGRI